MDDFYNARAARWVRDLVMKMDDDEVRPFVTMVTHGLLHEHIEKNQRTVNRRVAQIQKNLATVAKRSSSGGVLVPVIEQVSKSTQWDENKVKRDKGGQFSRTESRVRTSGTKPEMKKKQERQAGIPSARGLAEATGTVKASRKLTPQQRSAYQQQYQQIADQLDAASSRGARGIDVTLQDKRTGRRHTRSGIDNLDYVDWWNPGTHDAVSVGYSNPGTEAGAASFDLVSALGGSNRVAAGAERGVSNLDQRGGRGASSFQRQWNDASRDAPGTNDRTYRRIAAGSQLIGNIPSDKARAAGALGEFVGSFGPEAEKVVGPHLRRAAYRYRGTERKPDDTLIELANRIADFNAREEGGPTTTLMQMGQERATRQEKINNLGPEQKINIAERAAMLYFLGSEKNGLPSRLADNSLADLHRQSGKIPPSEGIIIDRNGEIVGQAVGFAEDHYLPFNLRNLKSLDGGAYIRTRSRGGLTTEDIYTGLMSGAREVSVVSNSGTFTIEFSPDFRGARRHSDKAKSMVERYAKTLDAIKSGQVERDKIDAKTRAELRAEVESQMPREMGYSEAEISNAIKERENDFRRNPQPTLAEIQEIKAKAAQEARGNEREQRIYEAQLMDALMEERRDRFYKLDGEGYATALRALQEQYPYFINDISFMNRRQQKDFRKQPTDPRELNADALRRFNNATDTGYVKPRYNRPADVQEGYYDESITGHGKIGADHTNYQNWEQSSRNRAGGSWSPQGREGGPRPQETAEAPPQGQGEATQQTPRRQPASPSPQMEARQAMAGAQHDIAYQNAMRDALGVFAPYVKLDALSDSERAVVEEARQDWDSVANDPAKMDALDGALENMKVSAMRGPEGSPHQKIGMAAEAALQEARVLRETSQRTNDTSGFEGPAYLPGAPPEAVEAERQKWQNTAQQAGFPIPEDLDSVNKYRANAGSLAQILGGEYTQETPRNLARYAARMRMDEETTINFLSRAQTPEGRQALQERMEIVAEAASRLQALGGGAPGETPDAGEGEVLPEEIENTPQFSAEDLMGMTGQRESVPAEPAGMADFNPNRLSMNLANHYATQAEQAEDDDQSAYWQDLAHALDNEQPDAEGIQMATEGLSQFPLTEDQERMVNHLIQEFRRN